MEVGKWPHGTGPSPTSQWQGGKEGHVMNSPCAGLWREKRASGQCQQADSPERNSGSRATGPPALHWRSMGHLRLATSARIRGSIKHFHFPSHPPTFPLTQCGDPVYLHPKTDLTLHTAALKPPFAFGW